MTENELREPDSAFRLSKARVAVEAAIRYSKRGSGTTWEGVTPPAQTPDVPQAPPAKRKREVSERPSQ